MRDRLVELIKGSGCVDTWNHYTDDFKEPNPVEELADHLLANGVIVPPCKVGDVVYKVMCTNRGSCCGITDFNCDDCPYQNRQVVEGNVIAIKFVQGIRLKVKFDKFTDYFCDDEVYLTKEEAEKKMKEGKKI